ncbi:MAG: DUF883 domain-containing protein [Burkholderia sp.]
MALTNSLEDKLDRGFMGLRRTGRRITRDAGPNAHNFNAAVKDDVRLLVEELEDLLQKEDTDVESLRKRLHDHLAEVRGTLNDVTDDALYRLRAQAACVSQAVHKNPWQTAGVVAGLAFFAGLLLARR